MWPTALNEFDNPDLEEKTFAEKSIDLGKLYLRYEYIDAVFAVLENDDD